MELVTTSQIRTHKGRKPARLTPKKYGRDQYTFHSQLYHSRLVASQSLSNKMTTGRNLSVSEARWGILRSALLGVECSDDMKNASIHRFEGWNLLTKTISVSSDRRTFTCSCVDQAMYHEILAWQCLAGDKGRLHVEFSELSTSVEVTSLRERLARHGILMRQADGQRVMEIKWSHCSYVNIQYSLDKSSVLFIRERKPRRRVAVRELRSHDLNGGVDNTGQARVWDSESTLTHCLLNKESTLFTELPILWNLTAAINVIELGVGMAGIAGLALGKTSQVNVLLTDGHPDAVDNNCINIRMNDLQGNVRCERLLWSADIRAHKEEADLVLCSDCTHFQEHHAGLMITLAHLLKIDGIAVLCQPPRAESLDRFLKLCDSMPSLWGITVIVEPILECLHNESLVDPSYDPNLHYPKIVLLKKLRELRDEDRQLAKEKAQERSFVK